MSYILDALRKADAQRARDPARGIHAQPAMAVAATAGSRRREYWAVGTAATLILVAAAWLWFGAPAVPPASVPGASVRVEPAPAPMPAAPATAVMPPAPEPVVPIAPPAVVAAAPKAPALAAARPAEAAPVAAPAAERTYSLAELPADVQQALPKFSVSGGVYSENVAQRMLVVNGQVFNEGSEIAPGVVLEQIRAKVALLKFRGLRIAQPY